MKKFTRLLTAAALIIATVPLSAPAFAEGPVVGRASWYGPGLNGKRAASGEIFNQNALTAAHRTLAFGTKIRVTNPANGKSVVVTINDRGPFHGNRILDLSKAAAQAIGLIDAGVGPISYVHI